MHPDRPPLGVRLERIRDLLELASAKLEITAAGGSLPYLQSGPMVLPSGKTQELEHCVRTSLCPLVIADTQAEGDRADDCPRLDDGRPVRFLAMLPLGGALAGPVHVLTLADTRPRTIDVANRLATLAMEICQAPKDSSLSATPDPDLLERAMAQARFGVWQCDLPNNILSWTAGVYDIFGIRRWSRVDRLCVVTQYLDSSRAEMEENRARALETGSSFMLDAEIARRDGQRRWMRLTGSVQSANGRAVRLFGTKQDVTEERRLIDHLRYLADTDAMTGLANRALLQERLARPEGIAGLLLVDLDDFKSINDTFGHAVGDLCLREAAHRLRSCCPCGSLVGRLGGDEFAILLEDGNSLQSAEQLARRIVEVMRLPLGHGGAAIEMGASVGLALRNDQSGEELFRNADQALYAAKAAGRRRAMTFNGSATRAIWSTNVLPAYQAAPEMDPDRPARSLRG